MGTVITTLLIINMKNKILLILFFLPFVIFSQDGRSLSLNGCTDYLEVAENDLLDFANELTIEFWIRPNCTEGNSIILGKEWCQGNFSYYASVADGNIRWSFQSHGGCSPANFFDTENTLIQAGVFSHVAIVHSQTDLKIYVNGVRASLNTSNGVFSEIHNSSEPFRIGVYKNIDESYGNFYSGLIDELRFWDIALSEQLILSRYQNILNGDESNLILYYQFEQIQTGLQLNIPNITVALNNQLPALAKGATSTSPYCIEPSTFSDSNILPANMFSICDIDSVQINLNMELNYKSIMWSTGENSSSIWIYDIGEYSVTVETERCNYYQFDFTVQDFDNIEIINIEICADSFVEFNGELLYPNDVLEFNFPNAMGCDSTLIVNGILLETQDIVSDDYIQSCDDMVIIPTNLSNIKINSNVINSPIEIFENGTYFIEGFDDKGCLIKDTIEVEFISEKVYLPNIINPASILNNCFRPYFANNNNLNYDLQIYDRWGNLIYDYFGNNACWDGRFKSQLVVPGVYVYKIIYDSDCLTKKNHTGSITVVR
jgi:gliding motility-associated-like protein